MRCSAIGMGLALCLGPLSCSDNAGEGETAERTTGEPNQVLVDSCRRWCGLMETFEQPCAAGETLYHGSVLGTDPPPEAPVSDDPECLDSCTTLSPRTLCWQTAVEEQDCSVEALWTCDADGGFSTNECGGRASAELCEGVYARPEAWRSSDEWTNACELYCALRETLLPGCTPGDTRLRGVPLGSQQPEEAPRSDDPACMDRCLMPSSQYECSQQFISTYNCFADALWVCRPEGGWYTSECEGEDVGSSRLCE